MKEGWGKREKKREEKGEREREKDVELGKRVWKGRVYLKKLNLFHEIVPVHSLDLYNPGGKALTL